MAQMLPNIFNGRLDVAPGLRAGRTVLYSTVAYLFYAAAVYYLANRTKPFPTLKASFAHAGLGTGLGFTTALICLILTPALYYHATRFTNPELIEWIWAIGFFWGAAAFEEIIYRGVFQNFFALFLHPVVATVLQVALFVWVHNPFPQTTGALLWRITALGIFGFWYFFGWNGTGRKKATDSPQTIQF